MKLRDIEFKPEDKEKIITLEKLFIDVYVLGHEEHLTDIGEMLSELNIKYEYKISDDIINSEEIYNLINRKE